MSYSPPHAAVDLADSGPLEVRSAFWSEETDLRPRPLWEVLSDAPPEPSEHEPTNAATQAAYEEGIRRARATVATIMDRYHRAIAELELLRDRLVIESEEDLVELSLHIAREVLESEVSERREFTTRMVAFALKTLRGTDSITLRVGPTDLTALRDKHPELISDQAVVRVVEDATLTLGGVVAECEIGRLDASIEGRLREAARQLRSQTAQPTDEDPR